MTTCRMPIVPVVAVVVMAILGRGQAAAGENPVAALEEALEQIYGRLDPAVVNVKVVEKEKAVFPVWPDIPGFPQLPFPQGPREFYREGEGSGFVWDADGHIVTNNHVVAGANQIAVTFSDGVTVPGKVVGADPDSDLAVVHVEAPREQLHVVELADSTRLKVGQLVVAIGNPFGLQGTMTVGVVSALGRLLPAGEGEGPSYSIPDVIQTDAPINPGNSGGVLADDQGRLVGVTAAIVSPVRGSAGIGFAIPSATVQKVVPQLIKNGRAEHPWLGVSGTSLAPDLDKAMGLKPDQRGGLVVDVMPGSPADKAGLHGSDRQVTIGGQSVRVGGDVITAIDGDAVARFDDLVTYLFRNAEPGKTVSLTILRAGEEKKIDVTLTARPRSEQAARAVGAGAPWLGIAGVTLTAEIAGAMHLPSSQKGVLVEEVEQGSPADRAGVRGSYKPTEIGGKRLLVGGDVIVAVGGKPVSGMEELQHLVAAHRPGETLKLTVLRGGTRAAVPVTLGEQPSLTS